MTLEGQGAYFKVNPKIIKLYQRNLCFQNIKPFNLWSIVLFTKFLTLFEVIFEKKVLKRGLEKTIWVLKFLTPTFVRNKLRYHEEKING